MKEIVNVPDISDALAKYNVPISAAVKANGFVFISGAPPIDLATGQLVKGNIEEQTEAVMRYLEKVLAASGSSFDKVVKITVFAANSGYFSRINESGDRQARRLQRPKDRHDRVAGVPRAQPHQCAIKGRLPHGVGVSRLVDLPVEWSRPHQMLGLSEL